MSGAGPRLRIAYTVATPEVRSCQMPAWTGDVDGALRSLRALGYHGVELMMRSPLDCDTEALRRRLVHHGLTVPAIGIGPAAQEDGLSLADPRPDTQSRADARLESFIDLAAGLSSQVNLGRFVGEISPGSHTEVVPRVVALLRRAAAMALERHVTLLVEPQARPVPTFVHTLDDAVRLIDLVGAASVKVLIDVCHLTAEESAPIAALDGVWRYVGHLHVAGPDRGPLTREETGWQTFITAALDYGYEGFVTIECRQEPTAEAAARGSIESLAAFLTARMTDRISPAAHS